MEVYPRTNTPIAPPGAQQTQRLMIWMVLIISLASIAIFGFVFWTMQRSVSVQQTEEQEEKRVVYKTIQLAHPVGGYTSFEIPSTWSVFHFPENFGASALPLQPTAAVGQTDVEIGDQQWAQVDFYYAQDDIVDRLLAQKKSETLDERSQAYVGGILADVYTEEETGSEEYYLRLPGELTTLKIHRQLQGDVTFDEGFQHMIKTIQFGL